MIIAVVVQIDRRKTLGDLKEALEDIVLVPATEFRVSHCKSSNLIMHNCYRFIGSILIIRSMKCSGYQIFYKVFPMRPR